MVAQRGPATRQERASGTVGGDHDELRVFGRLVVHGRHEAPDMGVITNERPALVVGRIREPGRDVFRDVGR